MTKILVNHSPQQQEKQPSGSADLARRFEWRLQWEKSQLENRQAYHKVEVPKERINTEPLNKGQINRSTEGQQQAQYKNNLSLSEVSSKNVESVQAQRISTVNTVAKGSGSITKDTGIANMSAAILPNGSQSILLSEPIQQKTAQYVRAMSMPSNLSTQQLTPGLHIYQSEGTVEVAFRSTRLNEKEGLKLIAALKKDLASLGLMLSRLTLNGETVWQSELNEISNGAMSCSDEAPVDKTY
ncbi:MAG: hypothetical protein ABW170_04780 [Candidatus Thiodiazotropha sp. L084R]